MANMYPKNIAEYLPEDSEKVVYYALKSQLPETFDVFYSVKWTTYEKASVFSQKQILLLQVRNMDFFAWK